MVKTSSQAKTDGPVEMIVPDSTADHTWRGHSPGEKSKYLQMSIDHLDLLFGHFASTADPGGYRVHLLAVWKDKHTTPSHHRRVFCQNYGGVEQAKSHLPAVFNLNQAGYDIYVCVAPLQPFPDDGDEVGGRTKADVLCSVACHVEVDITDEMSADSLEEIIKQSPVAPTFQVVSGPTGGRHLYFVLEEPSTDFDRVEAVSQGLRDYFNAKDAVHDVTRCLRLAGTLNQKPDYQDQPPFRSFLIGEEIGQ